MKKLLILMLLTVLAACQSAPKLEEDPRYAKLAIVINKHEFTEVERTQAKANTPSDSGVSVGIGLGIGSGSFSGGFGGMMMGMGSHDHPSDDQPQIAKGAVRYTVQPVGTQERIEVMSYEQHTIGDCVKVLAGHPSEYPRFFELKDGEQCK
jgi:hypothetical protein